MSDTATIDPDNKVDSKEESEDKLPTGFVEDYTEEEPDESTGTQKAETEDGHPQSADDERENVEPDNTDDAEDDDEDETKQEQAKESEQDDETDTGEEESEQQKAERMQKAIAAQAYENRELKRRLKELESAREQPAGKEEVSNQSGQQNALDGNKDGSDGPPRMPRMDDDGIEYDEDKYAEAMDKYHKSAQEYYHREQQKSEQQKEQERKMQEKVDTFTKASNELSANDPEYAKLVAASANIRFAPAVSNAILDSSNPAELHREVLSDPERLDKLNSMEPLSAMRELIKLELGLGDGEAPKQQPDKKTVSKAPAPVKVAKGASPKDSGMPAGYKEDY